MLQPNGPRTKQRHSEDPNSQRLIEEGTAQTQEIEIACSRGVHCHRHLFRVKGTAFPSYISIQHLFLRFAKVTENYLNSQNSKYPLNQSPIMLQRPRRRCEGTAMGAIVLDLRPGVGIGPFSLGKYPYSSLPFEIVFCLLSDISSTGMNNRLPISISHFDIKARDFTLICFLQLVEVMG